MYAETMCQPWLPQVVKMPFNVQLTSAPPSMNWGNAPYHSPLDSWGDRFSMVSPASQSLLWICLFLPEVLSRFVLPKHYSHAIKFILLQCTIQQFLVYSQDCVTIISSVQFSSVTQSCPTLCDPMDCSTQGLPVHHQLTQLVKTHVH